MKMNFFKLVFLLYESERRVDAILSRINWCNTEVGKEMSLHCNFKMGFPVQPILIQSCEEEGASCTS